MSIRNVLLGSALCLVFTALCPELLHAQVLQITPETVASSGPVEKALQENKGRAETSLKGNGAILRITYQASEPLTIYMVPLSKKSTYVPTDFLLFTLPATDGGTAEIDLTVSPGWSPRSTVWLLHVLTKDEHSVAGFATVEFLPSTTKIVSALFRHFFKPEPYTPSSYHALRGYRVFSNDMTILMGIFLILVCMVVTFFARKTSKFYAIIIVILTFHGLYGLRFGLDLVRFSEEHLNGFSQGLYDEAGSVYIIAPAIRAFTYDHGKTDTDTTVFVCRSGTNYKEKILRYITYPMTITADAAVAESADMVLVMDADAWSTETITDGDLVKPILRCGELSITAQKISDFPDGSILFTILR